MIWRHMTLLSMLAGAALIVVPAWSRPDIRFIWNASTSVPIGLYRIVPGDQVDVTDLAELAAFLDERRYLPRGLPLIKRVLALGGTTICRRGSAIIAYDGIYGQALARDTRGRPLPDWQGCRTLHDGEAFFMNWDSSDSFDSRYFGPLPITTIIGRAIPVWTTGAADPAAEFLRAPVSDEPSPARKMASSAAYAHSFSTPRCPFFRSMNPTPRMRQTIASSVTAWKLARPGIAPATVPVRTSP